MKKKEGHERRGVEWHLWAINIPIIKVEIRKKKKKKKLFRSKINIILVT